MGALPQLHKLAILIQRQLPRQEKSKKGQNMS
jgi:hypothetical protein